MEWELNNIDLALESKFRGDDQDDYIIAEDEEEFDWGLYQYILTKGDKI